MASYKKERLENDIIRLINRTVIHEIYNETVKTGHVTHVKLSDDLLHVTVYLDCYNREQIDRVVGAFNQAKGVFSRVLAHNLYLAKAVQIHFVKDKAIDNAMRIESIINSLKKSKPN
ncbi:30S ribosome-binding factor RbfA [Mycoplasmoides pneumoniae]|uniref:Ribosome-binding factor A n=4 Tax=Mycoplasmoides pneumoniae TaxID=2104 RepID=RBFA_MYCPN|nr:30S ribosome-binding factor RbfA [Mycoplasmoides pneumoniae]P75589.1 RecName: Full=Ribosome-binding factor A [Mycoplasmoides pneumoniae M129]1PA4_A Chain A, Probable ribosome-binding factor A [Mycoplasmoides pneumoniae]AAB96323.1 ribosome binding factor A [Mycoplasmoides pneumoniae M129]ADK86785.1 ribosome-binding factor A [Mycoplasmoides pneumoniae FH]AGC04083.1 ribosome-binding factor A [Mycoplasmoides pneumoniae M129-B7]ALA30041.1 ribosome-binding factor A [Mycoplasmoides pneumoniae PI 